MMHLPNAATGQWALVVASAPRRRDALQAGAKKPSGSDSDVPLGRDDCSSNWNAGCASAAVSKPAWALRAFSQAPRQRQAAGRPSDTLKCDASGRN